MASSALLKCTSLASLKRQGVDHNAWAGYFTLLCSYSCRRQWTQMFLESQWPKTKLLKSSKLFWFGQYKYYLNKFALSEFELQLFFSVTWMEVHELVLEIPIHILGIKSWYEILMVLRSVRLPSHLIKCEFKIFLVFKLLSWGILKVWTCILTVWGLESLDSLWVYCISSSVS